MASSSPPSNAITARAFPPKTQSLDVPLSNALNFIETLSQQGVAFAPAMPEAEALQAAANRAGITPQQALRAYLTILDYE
ncbi:hypothetical protein [Magnetovibrio sp.]|uniref:hypothetical protein n=1 Tax=Magnetovibrio sp. TaxID=2024836 RepID=UPI002F935967